MFKENLPLSKMECTKLQEPAEFRAVGDFQNCSFDLFVGYSLVQWAGPDGPGIESRWGEIFRTCPDRPWGPPSLLYNGYRVFPGGKERPERDADPSSLLVPWS